LITRALALRLARAEASLSALEITNLRSPAAESTDPTAPNPVASILKIRGTEIEQSINDMIVEILVLHALPYAGPRADRTDNTPWTGAAGGDGAVAEHLIRRAASIFGGTNEIQKNIIAKVVLDFCEQCPYPRGPELLVA
jgi:alkylation response protein AidB-like acyl-CoA dehydrogenase